MAKRDPFIDSLHWDLQGMLQKERFSITKEFAQKVCQILDYLHTELVSVKSHKAIYIGLIPVLLSIIALLFDKIADLI